MNSQQPKNEQLNHRFPLSIQFACVILYFGFDLILRFCYQAVLDGNSSLLTTTRTADKVDELYVEASYSKPAFLVLCCYGTFFFWGPLVVFPYLYFVRNMSILEYYTCEWSAALSFQKAFLYTCCMGVILFLGNLGYVAGLRYISVALGSALSQGEAPLTVFLSVIILGRCFGTWEKRGIVLSLMGIALIAIPPVVLQSQQSEEKDEQGQNHAVGYDDRASTWEQQLGGILSTLLGAFGFGAYQVFWPFFDGKRYNALTHAAPPIKPVHAVIDTLATLTLVGLFMIATGWILILFLDWTGLETFEIPPVGIRGTLLLSSVLSALTDALNGIACVVASTVVVALAYPLIIPLSVLLQWFVDGISPTKWGTLGWIGTVLVLAGVFCLESGDDAGNHIDDNDDDDEFCSNEDDKRMESSTKFVDIDMIRMDPDARHKPFTSSSAVASSSEAIGRFAFV